jgi:multimeric flavodoxin WrbA
LKILGISGSSRKNGNTAFLVKEALAAAKYEGAKTSIIHLADYNISDCTGCEGCKKTYRCVIQDGMQEIYPLLQETDAVILGSPTYFYDVTAITKAFLDRLYCFEIFDEYDRSVWMSVNEALGGKLAAVISVCEQMRAEDAGFAAKTMAMTLQSLGYRITDKIEIINLYHKGEAAQALDAQEKVRCAGRRLVATAALKQKIQDTLR